MKGLKFIAAVVNLPMLISMYALVKRKIKLHNRLPIDFLIYLIRILFAAVLALLSFACVASFAIYYEIVNLILKLKYGKDFVGIMEGFDMLWTVGDKTRNIINVLLMMEPKNEDCDELKKFFSENFEDLCNTHVKMGCVRDTFLGYNYFRKTKINIEKYVRFLEDYRNDDEFQALVDKHGNSPMPQNDMGLWEILVGKTPIMWKGNGEYLLYPVIVKYHHSVGDGISLVAMKTAKMIKGGVKIMKEKCDTYRALIQKNKEKNKKVSGLRQKIVKAWNKDYFIKYTGLTKDEEFNILHGKPLSGEKYLCYSVESENAGYVDRVKGIKNRLNGISFTDVILTALSASFAEYYIKNDQCPPKTIRTAMTYYIASPDFNKVIRMKNGLPVAKLKNNFSIGMVDVPIRDESIEGNILKRLKEVHQETETLKNSLDMMFMYWKIKIAGFLPRNLSTLSIGNNDCTLLVSNMLGNSTNVCSNDFVLRDTVEFAPNFLNQGITLSIFTFNNHFRFALTVDKSLIINRNEVQEIADNLFKYIDLLDNATPAE